jgi:hypothetical protein
MKKKGTHNWAGVCMGVALCLMTGALPAARAADTGPARQYVLDRINQIRQDPSAYARYLGYDVQTFTTDHPWLAALLAPGLPTVVSMQSLQAKAAAGNGTTDRNFLPAPDLPRVPAMAGTLAGRTAVTGKDDLKQAVGAVIDHQFRKELSPGFSGRRLILNRHLDLAGADVRVGRPESAESNGFVEVTVVLASRLTRSERQILNLVNQIRHDPGAVGGHLLFPRRLPAAPPRPPLFFHPRLQEGAGIGWFRADASAVPARNVRYPGFGVAALSMIENFPKTDADTLVSWLFSSLVVTELKAAGGRPVIFGAASTDAGISLTVVRGQAQDHVALVLVTGTRSDAVPGLAAVYGVVYTDADKNGIYSPGEGRPDTAVAVYNPGVSEPAAVAVTDAAGHFAVRLPPARTYRVRAGADGTLAFFDLLLIRDRFFALPLATARRP